MGRGRGCECIYPLGLQNEAIDVFNNTKTNKTSRAQKAEGLTFLSGSYSAVAVVPRMGAQAASPPLLK